MNTTTAPTSHHKEGPSQWPAFAECPDYEGERDIEDADVESLLPDHLKPKKAEKSAPGRGTAMHAGLAKVLTSQPDPMAGLSPDEEDQVRWVATSVLEYAASMGYTAADIRVEQRVTMYRGDSFEVEYFGTLDIRFGPFICDAKFGDERNYVAQLAGYMLPIIIEENLTGMMGALFYGRLKRVRHFKLDRATVETIAYSILRKRRATNRMPSVSSYCGWCSKRATCQALTGIVDATLAKRGDWAMRLPTMRVSEAGNDPVLIGALKWLWKAYLESWGEGLDFAAQTMTAGGIVPLGFKRQDEKGRLEIDDGAGALTALKNAGVAQEHLLAGLSHSMTGLAAAYRAQFKCSKDAAATKVEEILTAAGCARRGAPTFKLIRLKDAEDDIRAALAKPALTAGQKPAEVTNP